MKLRRRHELAAMHALQQKGIAKEDVQSIRVDGKSVDVDAVAQREADLDAKRAQQQERIANPNVVGRALEKIEARADGFQAKVSKIKYGDRVLGMMSRQTERVDRQHDVSVTLKDGTTLDLPTDFVDATASRMLHRFNEVGMLSGSIPIIGYFLPPLFAVSSLMLGQGARAMGDKALGQSLTDTGKKQLKSSPFLAIPVVNTALSALVLLKSSQDSRALLQGASDVDDVVHLAQQGKATVPATDDNPLEALVAKAPVAD